MAYLHDDVLDNGLSVLDTLADRLYICSQQPANYTEASSTYALGNKDGITVSAPQDGDASGRKVAVTAISDGSVTGTGTATHWAMVDVSDIKLLASYSLSSSQGVTSGNTFTLTTFDIEIPDPA